MNSAQIFDLIVNWLIDNTDHIVTNQGPGNYELIDQDPGYIHINAYNLSYREENALYGFEREFNQEYEGLWHMDAQPNNSNDVHRIYVTRDF